MFEILMLLAKSLAEAFTFDKLRERRQKKQLADIGADLYMVYTALNSILVTGERIVDELRDAENWMTRKLENGESHRTYYTSITMLLTMQSINVTRTIASLKMLALTFNIVDASTYAALMPLLHSKGAMLETLAYMLREGRLPSANLDMVEQQMEAARSRAAAHHHNDLVLLEAQWEDSLIDDGMVDGIGFGSYFELSLPLDRSGELPCTMRDQIRSYL